MGVTASFSIIMVNVVRWRNSGFYSSCQNADFKSKVENILEPDIFAFISSKCGIGKFEDSSALLTFLASRVIRISPSALGTMTMLLIHGVGSFSGHTSNISSLICCSTFSSTIYRK